MEVVLALGLFSTLLMVMGQAFRLLQSERDTTQAETALVGRSFDAVQEISRDVRLAGWTGDDAYPHLFADPLDPGEGFAEHVHEAPYPSSQVDERNQEIVFVHVADEDDDGIPDVELDGSLVWGDEEVSYVLVPSLHGRNEVQRRINGVFDRTIARGVESMRFDDWTTSGGEVPAGCVRVRLALGVDVDDRALRKVVQRTVRLVQVVD